jgi:N-acetyl-beta-hexosaminidase
MNRFLLFLLSIFWCMAGISANHPSSLLPLPQKYSFNGKNANGKLTIEEKYVAQIQGAKFQEEAYHLLITSKGILLEATTPKGMYWGKQTLEQLKYTKNKKIYLPQCDITDWPAFCIRGFMHDVGRSYIPVEELKREISLLSRYKINVFHWHLTENQAWRLECKKYPQLNAPENMEREKGKFYTLDEARQLVEFCRQHQVLLIPEIDMPGHSAAFERTFKTGMQSEKGTQILKDIIDEVCATFDVPYLHIGTDEVQFTNPDFVPMMVKYIRDKGKKVISYNPGWNYKPGEIDMMQLWSYRGKAQKGIPAIDCRFHYANHFDTYADLVAMFNSRIYNQTEGSDDLAAS